MRRSFFAVGIAAGALLAVSGLAFGLHGPSGPSGASDEERLGLPPSALVPLASGSTSSPIEVLQIGESSRGTPISVWRVGHPEVDALGRGPDERPALLIVAGLDGRHDFGTRLALTLVDRLASEHLELLRAYTVYIVPDLNPENDALFDMAGIPRAAFGRSPHSADADADGRFDEDPAEDLNGDGMITMMRIKHPAPGSGLRATLVLDPDEPRLLREPKEHEGEIAEYALLIEGIDNDNDSKYNEDGFAGSGGGGVDLDRNFPSLWPEHADGAGRYPLSEPETRKLVEWMLTRDNIVCALAFVPADNILNMPPVGKTAPDGREPTGIEEDDKPVYTKVQEVFKEITRQTGAPKRGFEGSWGGSFTHFAYAQFGVWSFATPGWVRPDLVKTEQTEDEGEDEAQKDEESPEREPDSLDLEAERRALLEQGVPGFLVEFIVATPDERAAIMAAFNEISEQERAARMQAVTQLPEEIQLRVRALISGQPDPGPFASAANNDDAPARTGQHRKKETHSKSKKGKENDEAKWLTYSDEHLDGAGFVEWTPFQHPQLGEVEIGGFVPGIRHEPPEREWARVADEQTAFVAELLGLFPKLTVEATDVERLADGLWRVRVRGTNTGTLPTRAAIGVKARRIPPIVVRLGAEVDDIVVGQRVQRWDTIAGHGGYEETEWTIKAPDGSTVPIEIRSSVFGDRVLHVTLTEGA